MSGIHILPQLICIKVKVGILEICEKGHYMLINALIKTYMSKSDVNIYVYTLNEARPLIEGQGNISARINYRILQDKNSVDLLFDQIYSDGLDRIHITTVTHFFKEFYSSKFKMQVYFHLHNIDVWFQPSWKIQLDRLIPVLKSNKTGHNLFTHLKYSLKEIFRDYYRKKYIRKVVDSDARLCILSEAQRFHLNKYTKSKNVLIFPTLIFESATWKDLSGAGQKLRICIPGSVSQGRRDYNGFFDSVESNFEFYKENITIDLLGFIPANEVLLLNRIKEMKSRGMNILYYTKFLDVNEFDLEIYKSDLILSNIKIDENEPLQGKETAAVFHMIRAAKPGLFPQRFTLDDEYSDSVLKFNDYSHLITILEDCMQSSGNLIDLKNKAFKLSEQFGPEHLIKRLEVDID